MECSEDEHITSIDMNVKAVSRLCQTASVQLKSLRYVHVEAKIASLGLEMPTPAKPIGSFVNFLRIDNMVYLSGHLPQPKDGTLVVGKVGDNLTVEQGNEAARFVALNLLATLKHNLGDLDRVKRVVKLFGLVNCVDGFTQHPAVINGCSDLMVKIFAENGTHVRSAVGTNSLPLGVPVEIEAVFEVHPDK